MEPSPTLAPVRAPFRAVVETVVPRAAAFDGAAWVRAEALVEGALAERTPSERRQLRVFLRLLDLLPFLRYGVRFPRLAPPRRLRVLRRLERAPLLRLRRGVWGVRTLALLAVYGQEAERARVGYRADPRGWEAAR
ncbi:MAG: hypothetical protein RQ751_03855 [Longimicrobiales bacterium]|nr:hypothetical protein [Longimicrobiales bacterium]